MTNNYKIKSITKWKGMTSTVALHFCFFHIFNALENCPHSAAILSFSKPSLYQISVLIIFTSYNMCLSRPLECDLCLVLLLYQHYIFLYYNFIIYTYVPLIFALSSLCLSFIDLSKHLSSLFSCFHHPFSILLWKIQVLEILSFSTVPIFCLSIAPHSLALWR